MIPVLKAQSAELSQVSESVGLSVFVEGDSNGLFIGISDASVAEMHLSGAWGRDGHHICPQEVSVVVRGESRRISVVANESVVEVRVSRLQIINVVHLH